MKTIIVATVLMCTTWFTSASAQDDAETCLSCHEDSELDGIDANGNTISMFTDQAVLGSSVHAEMECVDCHTSLAGFDDYPHDEELAAVDCSGCHDEVSDIYASSTHGEAIDNPNAATCKSCHGTHNILPEDNPEALTSPERLPFTCSECHHRTALARDPDIKTIDPFERYMHGIHAEGVSRGLASSASCNDCHGVHDLKRASHPDSKVNHKNIPLTCSQCHKDIYIKYERGIHGKALAAGITDSPNCADCHGEHEILRIDDPTSPVNASNLSDYVCGKCHNDQELIDKYGLSNERFSSYQDSYHGLALKGGSVKAASCISCHKAHDILPQTNPASSIHADNLTRTCQSCHPQANYEFATSYSHNLPNHKYGFANRTVKILYIILIIVVIGGMLVHNGIIFFHFARQRYLANRSRPQIRRFNGNMVFQHSVLTVSFIVLVITGFALRYPESWWVAVLNFGGITELSRSVIHRVSAVLLIYISLHHLLFLLMSRRGQEEFRAMIPSMADLTEAFQNIKYHLGLTKSKPAFDRYDYTEKAEYWALVWGTALMAATGFVPWFPTFFTSFLPAWVVTISETIHLYEAWLATLAIAVFHLFFTIFHPDRYPMSFTWIDGNMPKEEVKHHHPLWYDKIESEERASELEDSKAERSEQSNE